MKGDETRKKEESDRIGSQKWRIWHHKGLCHSSAHLVGHGHDCKAWINQAIRLGATSPPEAQYYSQYYIKKVGPFFHPWLVCSFCSLEVPVIKTQSREKALVGWGLSRMQHLSQLPSGAVVVCWLMLKQKS